MGKDKKEAAREIIVAEFEALIAEHKGDRQTAFKILCGLNIPCLAEEKSVSPSTLKAALNRFAAQLSWEG